jgi:hypothetical protein
MNELLKQRIQASFVLFKFVAWSIGFFACSWFLDNYESLMNAGKGLNYSGYVIIYSRSTNLFNEGIIGYATLALMVFSGLMFVKEMFSFQKYLRSLANSENFSLVQEVKSFV